MLNFLGSLWEECSSEFWGINKKKKIMYSVMLRIGSFSKHMFLKQKLLKNKTCHVIHFFLVQCLGMDIGEGAGEVEPSNQTLTDWRRGQKLGGTWPVEKWKSRPCVANMVKPTSTEVSSSSFLRRNCW